MGINILFINFRLNRQMIEKNIRLINRFLIEKNFSLEKNPIIHNLESFTEQIWEKKELKDKIIENKTNKFENIKFEEILNVSGFVKNEGKKGKNLFKQGKR